MVVPNVLASSGDIYTNFRPPWSYSTILSSSSIISTSSMISIVICTGLLLGLGEVRRWDDDGGDISMIVFSDRTPLTAPDASMEIISFMF